MERFDFDCPTCGTRCFLAVNPDGDEQYVPVVSMDVMERENARLRAERDALKAENERLRAERDAAIANLDFWKSHDKDADVVRESYNKAIEENERLRAERDALKESLEKAACGPRLDPSKCSGCNGTGIASCICGGRGTVEAERDGYKAASLLWIARQKAKLDREAIAKIAYEHMFPDRDGWEHETDEHLLSNYRDLADRYIKYLAG